MVKISRERKIKIKRKIINFLSITPVIIIFGFITILILSEIKSSYLVNQDIIEECFEDLEKDISINIQTELILFPDVSCEEESSK